MLWAQRRLATALFVFAGGCGCLPLAASADEIPFNTRLEVQGGEAGIEGTNGYVTLGGLAGVGLDRDYEDGMVFLDLAGHYSFEGDPAFNAALGYRYADWDDGVVWGINAGLSGRSYDDNWYLWCNVGLERLSPDFDLRANGYLRCGDGIKDERCETVGFEGNSLLVATRADLGMQGFDLSIGSDAGALLSEDLYGKAEFYAFFDPSDDSAIGGRASLDWRLMENVAVNGWVSYDTLFGVSGLAGITLSFGGPAERSSGGDGLGTGERLISFIERREILPVHENARLSGSTRAVTDENGDPLPFWHVDNAAAPGGDGTYERPWNVLADAGAEAGNTGPGDVIIFHEGDGTTTNQTDGITLQDGQYFLAASFNRPIAFDGCFCTLSELTDEGRPVMTDDDGDALRLADDNTTAGFDIEGAAQQGVSGDGIDSLTMIDVGVFNSGGSGIEIVNGTGSFLFSGLRVIGNDGNFAIDDAGGGFNLLNMAGEIVIEDTLCSENGVTGGAERQYDCVEVTGGATGALDVLVRGTRFLDNWGNGFETHLIGDDAMNVTLLDSLFERNSESAVTLSTDGAEGSGDSQWYVAGNTIRANGWSGIQVSKGEGAGALHLLIEDNVIADNATTAKGDPSEQSAISVVVSGGTSDVLIRGNRLSGHRALGVHGVVAPFQEGTVLMRIAIEDNEITGNGLTRTDDFRGGIMLMAFSLDPTRLGQLEATIAGNLLAGNEARGAQVFGTLLTPTPATLCANFQGNRGDDPLFANVGTAQTQATDGPPIVRAPGGDLFLDPAMGGNENPFSVSGPAGNRSCQTAQGF